MKRFALSAISLAAFMASGIAIAQTTPDQQPAQDTQQKQDCIANPQAEGCPTQPQAQQPATPAPDTNTASAVTLDASKSMLVTRIIGSSVFSGDENVGDVNDLIFDDKGTIQAAVIGVGGFLGMGEKDVAVPLSQITAMRDETNAIKLTITASREELEKAPAFDKTLFMVKTPQPDTTLPTSPGGSTTTPQQ
jgi:sporulation protein YlmC with PRC-barrel domain